MAEQPLGVETIRSKPVLVTGAGGLVGVHTCRELSRRGWKVRALVRDAAKGMSRLADLPLELRVGDVRDPATLRVAMDGVGAVVHLAAIAIERGGDSYASTNTEATRAILDSARETGTLRLIFMSQNGASSSSPHRFLRSKGIAEDLVRESDRKWTVLRPSVIFGPEDAFVNVLARMVRLSPVIFPLPGGGRARFQPVSVEDIARVISSSLERTDTIGGVYPLGGPAPLSLRQMIDRILIAMGARRILIPAPVALLRPVVALMQRIVPKPPVTTGLLDLLSLDNTVPDNAMQEVFGITPLPFAPEEIGYVRKVTLRNAITSMF